MEKAMQKIPDTYRLPFSMFVSGYKYHEIAYACETPIGTVKTLIYLARKLLKQELAEYQPTIG